MISLKMDFEPSCFVNCRNFKKDSVQVMTITKDVNANKIISNEV